MSMLKFEVGFAGQAFRLWEKGSERTVVRGRVARAGFLECRPDACRYSYAETGGACARMLRCKINSAKLRAPGGPVSSKTGDVARCEFAISANSSK
jgi:hypothetical protein